MINRNSQIYTELFLFEFALQLYRLLYYKPSNNICSWMKSIFEQQWTYFFYYLANNNVADIDSVIHPCVQERGKTRGFDICSQSTPMHIPQSWLILSRRFIGSNVTVTCEYLPYCKPHINSPQINKSFKTNLNRN